MKLYFQIKQKSGFNMIRKNFKFYNEDNILQKKYYFNKLLNAVLYQINEFCKRERVVKIFCIRR